MVGVDNFNNFMKADFALNHNDLAHMYVLSFELQYLYGILMYMYVGMSDMFIAYSLILYSHILNMCWKIIQIIQYHMWNYFLCILCHNSARCPDMQYA